MTADQTAKADGGKTHPLLLQKDMAPALYLIQRVLDYGCEKYERRAWHGVDTERWDDAQRRHQQKIDLGEQFDDESRLPHRAHQIAGLIILFMHELGVNVTLEEVLQLAKYNPPPQDHKVPVPDSPRRLSAKLAKVGDHVVAKTSHKNDNGVSVLTAGTRYKVKADDNGCFLIKDDRGIGTWYGQDRFL